MGTRAQVLAIAEGEVGYSRWNDPEQGTKYGRWYAQWSGDSYYGTSGVPYCAMFASWVLWQADVSAPGMPAAYVPYVVNAARQAGRTPYNENAWSGDLVAFDWNGDGEADHIGIVYENCPGDGGMWTIEGNTSGTSNGSQSNGGVVAKRWRSYSSICCIIVPYYNEETTQDTEEDEMTEDQSTKLDAIYDACAGWMQGTFNEVMRTDDPTGRGHEMKDHDHLKWIAAKQAKMDEKLDAIIEKLGMEVDNA